MNRKMVLILFASMMVLISAGFFLAQAVLFRRPGDTGFYLLQDLAFLPINVLFVTLGVNAFVSAREKHDKLDKINILIGEFFAEYGFDTIRTLNSFVGNIDEIVACASAGSSCGFRDLRRFTRTMENSQIDADATRGDLQQLRASLVAMKPALLSMFENPNLLEHDRFTEMLWALYHLMDELRSRGDLTRLPQQDLKHLTGDIRRAYLMLVVEWATIMRHMQMRYPYLYSMATRKNPFERNDIVVKE